MTDLRIISQKSTIQNALQILNNVSPPILFIIDDKSKILGSLTDGDIRRGLLKGFTIDSLAIDVSQKSPRTIKKSKFHVSEIVKLRNDGYKLIPVVDDNDILIEVLNLDRQLSRIPADVLIMAGGEGSRLRPLTNTIPKPLLNVGDKPIIDHIIGHLSNYGFNKIYVSINYMGDKIAAHLTKNYLSRNIECVRESSKLGTIGSASLINNFESDYILVTNADILTNLNFENFFLDFIEKEADMSILSIPYTTRIPYAILDESDGKVVSFREKPSLTYKCNAGIYLIRRKLLQFIPKNEFFNATDLMEKVIDHGLKITSYTTNAYWLDIGKPEDYKRAQEDVKKLTL